MRTAWFEDMLSLIPPAVFLIASRVSLRRPTAKFPYGYHRATAAGHLIAGAALAAMGLYLLIEALVKLATAEHPTIGTVEIFGHAVWLGWLMLPALLWSALPAVFLGRAKLPLAESLHDRVLHADAKMNKADWLTAVAGIVGVLGIGLGFWWADAAAAAVISLDIVHDGWTNTRVSVTALMDERPISVDGSKHDPLPERLADRLRQLKWVQAVEVRVRDEGHVFFGEAFIVPKDERHPVGRIQEAVRIAREMDWRLHELTVTLVPTLAERRSEAPGDGEASTAARGHDADDEPPRVDRARRRRPQRAE
jgi:cation diffusion facilitator family transporter